MNRKAAVLFVFLLVTGLSSAHAHTAGAVSPDATLKKYLAIWVGGDMSLVDQVFDPKVVRHHPASIQPLEISGVDAYKMYIAAFRQMHPDLKFEVMDTVASGNTVAYRYSASALNPATQKRFTFSGIALSKYGPDGRIVEEWVTWDTYDLMAQVGLIEPRKQQ
jgi:predicted ester cyclase